MLCFYLASLAKVVKVPQNVEVLPGGWSRQLCGFTHPDLAEVPDVPQQYRGIKALKDALKSHLQRHFCDVCLEGRKV